MEDEKEFEQEVRTALRRVEAPQGFAARVVIRAAARKRPSVFAKAMLPAWHPVYAAAALVAVVAGGVHLQHVRATERRTQEAQQQFARAMDMTDHALDRVSLQLQRGQIGQITSVLDSER